MEPVTGLLVFGGIIVTACVLIVVIGKYFGEA